MSEYESLREDIAAFAEQGKLAREMATHHLLEQSRQIDKLWQDNAELRDELHALANRVETLTRAVMADPTDVAQAVVGYANRAVLRTVTNPEGKEHS